MIHVGLLMIFHNHRHNHFHSWFSWTLIVGQVSRELSISSRDSDPQPS